MIWSLPHGRRLDFGARAHVVGILNTTPDSFYDGGRHATPTAAADRAVEMVEEGVDIIDIGGESSRPPMYGKADRVPIKEEIARVVPVIEAIRRDSDVPISVDTTKCDVARAALDAGADIVNDISALGEGGQDMLDVVVERQVPVILMHRRGMSATMQLNTVYDDLLGEVGRYLADRVQRVQEAGVIHFATDPGIGFGKSVEDNHRLLRHAGGFSVDGCPVMIGASRKSFLWKSMGRSVEDALAASVAAAVMAAFHGARILRVHDVGDTVDALRVSDAIRTAGEDSKIDTTHVLTATGVEG